MFAFDYILNSFASLLNFKPYIESLVIAATAAATVFTIEILINKNESSIQKIFENKKTALIDVLFWFFHYSPLFIVVMLLSTFGVLNVLKLFLHYITLDVLHFTDGYTLLFLLFIAYDFAGYWAHRLTHKFSITWKFHELHHSARVFTVFTVHRVHPVDSAIIKFFQTLVVLVLGASNYEVLIFTMLTVFLGTVKHSNLRFNYPGIFKYIIQSPAQHWIHHSENPSHYNKNYGEILQIWDVIFGTSFNVDCEAVKKIVIGTPDTADRDNKFLTLLIYPYKYLIKKITPPFL